MTFLIYLNEDFDGGATTFFLPSGGSGSSGGGGDGGGGSSSGSSGGGLEAWGVQPQMGAALCFPQANCASLLHEGSAVTRGTKYVVRTDVLYASSSARDAAPK